MTLRNIELLSSFVSFSFTSRHFPAFLKCHKLRKPSKYKFALNSFFSILVLASFFLSTVELVQLNALPEMVTVWPRSSRTADDIATVKIL